MAWDYCPFESGQGYDAAQCGAIERNAVNNEETMIVMTKDQLAATKKKGRRILGIPAIIAAPIAAVLAFGGVALAAILFSMTGSATAQADNGTTPTISGEHFSGKFYPGAERDLIFTVNNTNEFPVKVTSIAATGISDLTAGCEGGAKLSGFATAFNQDKALAGGGVTVPAGDSAVVTIPKAVKLHPSATAGCGFKINLKVTGSGAGN